MAAHALKTTEMLYMLTTDYPSPAHPPLYRGHQTPARRTDFTQVTSQEAPAKNESSSLTSHSVCFSSVSQSIHAFNHTTAVDEWSHLDELFMESLLWGHYGGSSPALTWYPACLPVSTPPSLASQWMQTKYG